MSEIGEEHPKELSCFPVTREATENALTEIAKNPGQEIMKEGSILQSEDTHLNQLILSLQQALGGVSASDHIQGALWTYKILRLQAEARGVKLPKLTKELAHTYLIDRIQEAKGGKSRPIGEAFSTQAERMQIEDPELSRALNEITKYKPRKEFFMGGGK